jgi:hypothetical protein
VAADGGTGDREVVEPTFYEGEVPVVGGCLVCVCVRGLDLGEGYFGGLGAGWCVGEVGVGFVGLWCPCKSIGHHVDVPQWIIMRTPSMERK